MASTAAALLVAQMVPRSTRWDGSSPRVRNVRHRLDRVLHSGILDFEWIFRSCILAKIYVILFGFFDFNS
jgi:hypothetical protein